MADEPNAVVQEPPQSLKPWFRLLRLPMLLTVPGEPVAGFLLASSAAGVSPKPLGVMLAAAGASVFFAVFSRFLGALLDLPVDASRHPDRPLPSGEVTAPQVRMAAIVSALSGLNLALFAGRPVLYAGAALCGLIFARHAFLKRLPLVGACSAGLCRAASLLAGALAANPGLLTPARLTSRGAAPLFLALACVSLYAAAVSHLADAGRADGESAEAGPPALSGRIARRLPFLVLLVCLTGMILAVSLRNGGGTAASGARTAASTALAFLSAIALLRSCLLGGVLYRSQPLAATISGHSLNLLLIQGALCSAAGTVGLFPAVTFILLSVLFGRLRRS